MRGRAPMLYCDAEDGFCSAWELDYYEATVSAVNDVPVTTKQRAPGWRSTDLGDFCPEHAPTTPPASKGGGAS